MYTLPRDTLTLLGKDDKGRRKSTKFKQLGQHNGTMPTQSTQCLNLALIPNVTPALNALKNTHLCNMKQNFFFLKD